MSSTPYPLTKEEFVKIYSKVPRLTVELIIKSHNGILLTKRSIEPYIGSWHIPGGTVYYKESLEDALDRVAKDELGVEINIIRHVGFIYYPNIIKNFGWDWPIGVAYLANIKKGTPRGSVQGEEVRYFKEIPENMVPSQGEFLMDNVQFISKIIGK